MDESESFEYDLTSGVAAASVQEQAELVWRQLRKPGTVANAEALKAGIDIDRLPQDLGDALDIRESAAGLDPATIHLIVAAVGGAVAGKLPTMVSDLWKFVILPQLRQHFGDRAIADRKSAEKAAHADAEKKP